MVRTQFYKTVGIFSTMAILLSACLLSTGNIAEAATKCWIHYSNIPQGKVVEYKVSVAGPYGNMFNRGLNQIVANGKPVIYPEEDSFVINGKTFALNGLRGKTVKFNISLDSNYYHESGESCEIFKNWNSYVNSKDQQKITAARLDMARNNHYRRFDAVWIDVLDKYGKSEISNASKKQATAVVRQLSSGGRFAPKHGKARQ